MNATALELSGQLRDMLAEPEPSAAVERVQIPDVGIYRDMPIADYLALPCMSAGRLEKLRRSPLQYLHSLLAPEELRPALERGTALHLAVLEPALFDGNYVVLGQCEGITKNRDRCSYQGSVWRSGHSYCKTHDPQRGVPPDDVEVLPQKDYDAVLGMREAIHGHARAHSLFEGAGDFEVVLVFDDPNTGVRCKIRPDRLIERAGMLVDIKSCRDAAEWAFPRQAENLGYFRKLALYRRGLRAHGWPIQEIAVLAIESEAPYDLAPYLVDPNDIDATDDEVSRLLRLFVTCKETNRWPGYAASEDGFLVLRRPAWAQNGEQRNG